MAQLTVNATTDFRGGAAETNIFNINFTNTAGQIGAIFDSAQFGLGLVSNTVNISGSGVSNADAYVQVVVSGDFSAAGWQFTNWTASDEAILQGSSGNNDITGTSQTDLISNGGGLDRLSGGAGDDIMYITSVFANGSSVDGGANSASGFDVFGIEIGGFVDFTNVAISNIEHLRFSASAGSVAFFTGDQIANGGFTKVTGIFGTVDTLSVQGMSVDLSGLEFGVWDSTDIIGIAGTSAFANTLIGSDQADRVNGTDGGFDVLVGGLGLDDLQGRGGDDIFRYLTGGDAESGETISGGAGNDTIRLENAGAIGFNGSLISSIETLEFAGIGVSAKFGANQFGAGNIVNVTASATADSLTIGVFNLGLDLSGVAFNGWNDSADHITIQGGTFADQILGSAQADLIQGGAANDSLFGGAGNDTFDGGTGADVLNGSLGNDTYINPTGDSVLELSGQGTDTVQSAQSFSLAALADVERLFLTGSAAIDGNGNALANLMQGNTGANVLNGFDGNDTLQGNDGADRLNGGDGADSLRGGMGADRLAPGTDTFADILGYASAAQSTGPSRDTIVGFDANGEDKFDLPTVPVSFAAAIGAGALNEASFDADLSAIVTAAKLGIGQALLLNPASGTADYANTVYLIVDANGIAGYQAGGDYVFQLQSHTGGFDIGDFI